MEIEDIKTQARIVAGLSCWLEQDVGTANYSVMDHNVCSAFVEYPDGRKETFFSYSNPSRLSSSINREYNFVSVLNLPQPIINRGGMQDLHTEVRLINYLYENRLKNESGVVISFFSMRSVCKTCRKAILDFMEKVNGLHAIMAFEFKIEQNGGQVTDCIYPITQGNIAQERICYL